MGNWPLQSVRDPVTMRLQVFALCLNATSNRPKCETNFHFRVQRFSIEAKEKNLRRSRDASSEVFSFGQNLSIPKMPLMLKTLENRGFYLCSPLQRCPQRQPDSEGEVCRGGTLGGAPLRAKVGTSAKGQMEGWFCPGCLQSR